MRAVIQRVNTASVSINGSGISKIGKGLLVFLGVKGSDSEKDIAYIADKTANLRIFEDKDGKMNLSVSDINAEILAVPQFTLYGDARKGRRPSFTEAGKPEIADSLYNKYIESLKTFGLSVKTGKFQEMMNVKLENYGPVTILLDSEKTF